MPCLVDALSARTAIHTELQILGGVVGLSELLRDPHRQRQVSTQLANDYSHTDVASMQFHVATGAPFRDPQSPDFSSCTLGVSRKLDGVSTAHCSIVKGCGKVVGARLVDLLLRTTLVGLEDDGDLDREMVKQIIYSLRITKIYFSFFFFFTFLKLFNKTCHQLVAKSFQSPYKFVFLESN